MGLDDEARRRLAAVDMTATIEGMMAAQLPVIEGILVTFRGAQLCCASKQRIRTVHVLCFFNIGRTFP
jgi:hypothetical protein